MIYYTFLLQCEGHLVFEDLVLIHLNLKVERADIGARVLRGCARRCKVRSVCEIGVHSLQIRAQKRLPKAFS